MKILAIPGLTLPTLSQEDQEMIVKAYPGAELVIASARQATENVRDANVILGIIDRELFLRCESLRWIQSISSGIDMFLFREFVESDVVLTSEKGLVGEHLADHAFSLLLMLTRQTARAMQMGPEAWNHRAALRSKEFELSGLTMGCFGFGSTGRNIARRARAFGMNVIALDREQVDTSPEVEKVMLPESFDELLSNSDVLAICCPLTRETRGIFNENAFAKMRDDSILVNVTRGEVMDEEALVFALRHGHIGGAALDVTPSEPLPIDSPLWTMNNVVMSPHTAGASQFRAKRNLERFCRNLVNFREGRELEGLIDKQLGY